MVIICEVCVKWNIYLICENIKVERQARHMGFRSAIVVGATGLVGSHLIEMLCESDEYISVTAIARRKIDYQHPKLNVKIRDFDHLAESDLEFAHEVFCCLGTTIKKAGSKEEFEKVDVEYPLRVAALAKNRRIPHFIVISAMGANEKSLAYYSRVKGKLEKELEELEFERLSIVRPSLLVGDRKEFRLGEKTGEVALKLANPLLMGGMKKFRSIEASQVALAMMVIALDGKKEKVAIYESGELATMSMPLQDEEQEPSGKLQFNWDKLNRDEPAPLDKDISFDRSKLKGKNED